MKKSRLWISLFVLLAWLVPGSSAIAQDAQPAGPVYIVQEGDSLWDIAQRFGVSVEELESANEISDPSQLSSGARLVIPGMEGIQGVLVTEEIPFGETLRSLSRRYRVPETTLVQLNHLTSPSELYAGASLIIPQQTEVMTATRRVMAVPGQSVLELAAAQGANPWALVAGNGLTATTNVLPGDVLQLPDSSLSKGQTPGPGALPGAISAVELKPLPLVQGKAVVIQVTGGAGLSLTGMIAEHELHFFPLENGEYVALQGIHAMLEPGFYPLSLSGKLADGTPFAFSQKVFIRSGDYLFDPGLTVNPETIDPAVTKPEDAQWTALAAPVTPEKLWDGIFQSPAPPPFNDCWPSLFGSRRSYNGSAYIYFHSGLDFCGGVGTEIHAPAAGKVVFAGPLTVRGNATMIDHGWGIYTGYMHQSQIFVHPGDRVQAGEVIGLVGGTGRVTGPHLHWEVFAGGVQVDPLDWLQQVFP